MATSEENILYSIGAIAQEIEANYYDVRFLLFNKDTEKKGQKVLPTRDSVSKSKFVRDKKNKILIHGFHDGSYDKCFNKMKSEYLLKEEYLNIWLVDWRVAAAGPVYHYPIAMRKMRAVAEYIADLVKVILKMNKEAFFHVIGHSLGAHMAGYVAEIIQKKPTGHKFERITGLDPALPGFERYQNKNRVLKKTDADFVDIIHTNAQMFGYTVALGHVDFYVNKGFHQPGCSKLGSVCDHNKAVEYFAESINSEEGFYGSYCETILKFIENKKPKSKKPKSEKPKSENPKSEKPKSEKLTAKMGEDVDKEAVHGSYIVMINKEPPYAMGLDERSENLHEE